MKIRPLHDRILVTRSDETETKHGSIIIPDSAKEKPHQGTVKGVGSGKLSEKGERFAPEVKVGDRILYGKYSGSEIKVDGEEYLIVKEDEILAILD
jgi:chaperonin GroES